MKKFNELTPQQQREARYIFSELYSFECFIYEIDGKGHVTGRRPLRS